MRRGDLLGGRYRVESVIDANGAQVLLAGTATAKGQPVVIEVLRTTPENADAARIRFLAEARKAAGVVNVHVTRVLHVGVTSDGHPFAVREGVEDGTLASLMFEEPSIPTEHAVDIALDLCDALAEAHAHGVVHGAISPACVHLGYSVIGPAFVKLTGLGTAHVMSELGYTPGGLPVPLLRAPEILRRDDAFDVRADVWGVGVILYTLLAGSPPFQNETPSTTDLSIAWEEPPSLAGVPDALAEVVDACLGKDPGMRPQTVLALADKLLQFSSNPAEALARVVARTSARRSTPPPPAVGRASATSYVARREVSLDAPTSMVMETGPYKAVQLERLVENAKPSAASLPTTDELDSDALVDDEIDVHVSVRDLSDLGDTATREVLAVAPIAAKAPSEKMPTFPKASPVVVTTPMEMPASRPAPSSIAPTAMSIAPVIQDKTEPMRNAPVRTLTQDLAPRAAEKPARRARVASAMVGAACLAAGLFLGLSSRTAPPVAAPAAAAAQPPAAAMELPVSPAMPSVAATDLAVVTAPTVSTDDLPAAVAVTPTVMHPAAPAAPVAKAAAPAAKPIEAAPKPAAEAAPAPAPKPAAAKGNDDDLRRFLDDRR